MLTGIVCSFVVSLSRVPVPLCQAKQRVENELEPFYKQNKDTGCTIASDGWSDVGRRPILNVMVCARGEAVFRKSINMSDKEKTGVEIAGIILATIEELGPDDVVAVTTDNAANCKV